MKKLLKLFLLSFTILTILSFFGCSSDVSEEADKAGEQTEITKELDSARYGFSNQGSTGHSPSSQSSISSN